MKNYYHISLYLIVVILLVSGCTPTPTPTAIATLVPTETPEPTTAPTLTATPIPAATSTPTATPLPPILEILSPEDEAYFELSGDESIIVSGTYENLSTEDHVWIFLEDKYEWYYLQNPSAKLFPDGTWEQTNARPGQGIRYIIAIYVNADGHSTIENWVKSGLWTGILADEIEKLGGYLELDRVKVRTPGI